MFAIDFKRKENKLYVWHNMLFLILKKIKIQCNTHQPLKINKICAVYEKIMHEIYLQSCIPEISH